MPWSCHQLCTDDCFAIVHPKAPHRRKNLVIAYQSFSFLSPNYGRSTVTMNRCADLLKQVRMMLTNATDLHSKSGPNGTVKVASRSKYPSHPVKHAPPL